MRPGGGMPTFTSMGGGEGWAVEVTDLTVVRGGRVVLPGLSLRVPHGQVLGLLGPSGSGKSTLIRSIVGSQVVRSGTVTVLGAPAGSAAVRGLVGYLTQSPSVYDDLTVIDNVRYFAAMATADDPAGAAERAVAEVDLTEFAGSRVDRLSGGQRARVGLAAALVGSPDLLVLDEPTVELDPVLRRDLWDLFHRLAARGTTLFVSSHVMDEASRCDRLVLLREGSVLADATLPDLLAQTGCADVEDAFLHLIDEAAAS